MLCAALMMSLATAHADEGMWLLKLMKQQHLEDSLRKAGLQLPPEALYSETAPSLRECIGIFNACCNACNTTVIVYVYFTIDNGCITKQFYGCALTIS